jgi:hypothetical protein
MNLVRRLGEVNPERLAGEVASLRKESENLRLALGVKVATYVRTINLGKGDVLVVRPPKGISIRPEAWVAVLEHVSKLMKDRLGWEGPILFEGNMEISKQVGGSDGQH